MSEEAAYLDLSDGGHFENLGIYELIRRRTDFIISSDASMDGDYSFDDLGRAVELVRTDFGVNIRFGDDDTDLAGVLPGTDIANAFRKKFNLAKRGYALGTIEYPAIPERSLEKKSGHFLYIKSTLTRGLPADLYGYKAQNPAYPDQSTADQFFDEAQFEAYRELGYRLTKAAMTDLGGRMDAALPPKAAA